MQLCVALYEATKGFPREELYGLTSQMRRASVSIMSNIAEGHGRDSRPKLSHFTSISRGSCAELEAQILLARELGYMNVEQARHLLGLCEEVGRMLTSMLRKFKAEAPKLYDASLAPIT